MTQLIKGIKGMPDVLPVSTPAWAKFEKEFRQLINLYGYEEIRLPILESTKLFKRSIGEVTDIVEKEMFTFLDRNEESMSLRPEGTAGCVRACLEHGLLYNQEQRLWYMGPMFRYEKPQLGRFRQFHQVGVEAFGYPGPDIEVEHILMMARFWKRLGISEHIQLQINTLFNPFPMSHYKRSDAATIKIFQEIVMKAGIIATTRKTRGDDIDAACGQLKPEIVDRTKRSERLRKLHFKEEMTWTESKQASG